LNFLAIKYAIDELPTIFSAGLRFALVFLVLFPFMRIIPGKMKQLLLAGFIIGALHFSVLYIAMAYAEDISSVAIATLTNVPFATILAVFFLGERIGIFSLAGTVMAFAGVMVIGFDPKALDHFFDLSLVMFASFLYATGAILLRRLSGVSVMNLQGWIGLIGMISVLSVSFLLETGQIDALVASSWQARGGVIFSALGSSVIGHGGLYFLIKRYPVSTVAPLTLLSQIFAGASGVIILGEVLTTKMILGGILTFGGVAVILLRQKKKTKTRLGRLSGEK
ncbi:MAG: DMT family transporter, partial [Alphaproteobacteria bacterium]